MITKAYTIEEQFSWRELPLQEQVETATAAESGEAGEATDDEAARLIAEAHRGRRG